MDPITGACLEGNTSRARASAGTFCLEGETKNHALQYSDIEIYQAVHLLGALNSTSCSQSFNC